MLNRLISEYEWYILCVNRGDDIIPNSKNKENHFGIVTSNYKSVLSHRDIPIILPRRINSYKFVVRSGSSFHLLDFCSASVNTMR